MSGNHQYRPITIVVVIASVLAVLLGVPVRAAVTPSRDPVVYIAAFSDAESDSTVDPVSHAIRDLLLAAVSETDRVRLVERDALEAILREQVLSLRGLIDPDASARVGQLLGADRMVTGRYWVEGDRLTVVAHVVDVPTAVIQATCQARGEPAGLLDIVVSLAGELARALEIPFDPGAITAIDYRPIASLNFLRGLGYYHAGNFLRALMDFMVCGDLDPDRHERHLWMGRAYFALGEYGHARVEVTRFLSTGPEAHQAVDARALLAQCEQALEAGTL